jgi:hypothetical protein
MGARSGLGLSLQAWAACGMLTVQQVHSETLAMLRVREGGRKALHGCGVLQASLQGSPNRQAAAAQASSDAPSVLLLLAIQLIGATGQNSVGS